MSVCEYCGKAIPAGRMKYCGGVCRGLGAARKKRERRAQLRQQVTLPPCRYNPGVDCPDRSGCAGCGWHPAVAARRLEKLRRG